MAVAHFAGSYFVVQRSWGSAPLHPRLYAIAALRGLSTKPFTNLIKSSSVTNSQVRTREMKYNPPQAKITIGVHTAGAGGSNACSPNC